MGEFKIGDRVNWIGQSKWRGATITAPDSFFDWRIEKADGTNYSFANERELEHAPLTIRAGRYYRTRDGRKAINVRKSLGDWFADIVGGPYGKAYQYNGRHGNQFIANIPEDDLIAEWVDEPAAAVAAAVAGCNDDATPKFKVGDRVCDISYENLLATVAAVQGDKVGVHYDGGPAPSKPIMFPATDYVLVESEPAPVDAWANGVGYADKPAIVCWIDNCQPRPSKEPHVHGSRAKAEKEAARLAGVNKGKEFGVYELVSTRREEPVKNAASPKLDAFDAQVLGAVRRLKARGFLAA